MGRLSNSDLPEELLAVLPNDPYDQLEIARKITSMAVTSRVGELEAETMSLRHRLADKELLISDLQARVGELQQALQQSSAHLSRSLDEQTKLTTEKNNLAASVKKLTRDVAKLEIFKQTLVNSLQEDDENHAQDNEDKLSATKFSAVNTSFSSLAADRDYESTGHRQRFSLTPPTNVTPEMTPSGSPKRPPLPTPPKARSAAVSPKMPSTAGSPKWRSTFDGRISLPTSLPSSKHSTAPNSPPHAGSQSARTARVDGKEFFRQARNRLSYEQFSAFLTNIKQLNAHLQTKEETLRKASEIFGPGNEDLYCSFDGLLRRHLPHQG